MFALFLRDCFFKDLNCFPSIFGISDRSLFLKKTMLTMLRLAYIVTSSYTVMFRYLYLFGIFLRVIYSIYLVFVEGKNTQPGLQKTQIYQTRTLLPRA